VEFLRPFLLWGLLGIAVPVVIHLLGRRRVRTVPIATLRFLERARVRASAHLKLRRLLLLAARAAALGLLASLYAGPGCREPGTAVGPATWVLLLDTSPSMAATRGGRSPLADGKRALRAILDRSSPEDRFLAVTTWEDDEGWRRGFTADPAAVRRDLEAAHVIYGRHRPERALEAGLALLEGTAGGRIAFATDLQASAWSEAPPARVTPTGLELIDVGLPSPQNGWIASVEEAEGVVRVRVGASGGAGPERRTVHLDVGAERRLTAFLEREETSFRFEPPPGVYEGRARLEPGGDLNLDDELPFAGRGRTLTRVLLVNGDPRGFEIRDELLFVRRALAPGGRLAGTMEAREVRLGDLVPADLDGADVVFLANPAGLRTDAAEALQRRLIQGLGVVVTVGDRWPRDAAPQGLVSILAAPIRDVVAVPPDDPSRRPYESVELRSLAGPFAVFRDRAAGDLSGVHVERYWLPDARVGDGVDVWMRLENGAPLLVERRVGKGRTLLLGTTVDRDGADLCLQPAFLPWLERLLLHAAGRLRPPLDRWALAGRPVDLPYTVPATIEGPDGKTFWKPGDRFVPPELGVYRILTEDGVADAFSARLDPAESDLTPLARTAVEERLGLPRGATTGAGGGAAAGRRDASGRFAVGLLLALGAEALLSARWERLRRRRPLDPLGEGSNRDR
jgi:hypothetical protein